MTDNQLKKLNYAQAIQIAITLSGVKSPPSLAYPDDTAVENQLSEYRKLALSVARALKLEL